MGLQWGLNELRQLICIKFLEQSSVLGKHLIYAYCSYYYKLSGGSKAQSSMYISICYYSWEKRKQARICNYTHVHTSRQTSMCVHAWIHVLAWKHNIFQERSREVEDTDVSKEGSGCWWQERFFTAFLLLLVIFKPLPESFILTSATVTGISCRKSTQGRRSLPDPWW